MARPYCFANELGGSSELSFLFYFIVIAVRICPSSMAILNPDQGPGHQQDAPACSRGLHPGCVEDGISVLGSAIGQEGPCPNGSTIGQKSQASSEETGQS